jgi:hypothetical protein
MGRYTGKITRFCTAIRCNPSGNGYSLVGSVPKDLCHTKRGIYADVWVSPLYQTQDEATAALVALGLPFFQLPDCSWYPREPATDEDRAALDAFWAPQP